ncbi:WS/DGAT/MGAT family O-acyltransferase [Nonomuraea soli]|uniref:Diacylglycerol O-acyltransferase n=1 Tax=Nonomuraea soli TaxID=1032476 RepID=A0A7W0HNQ6_9ACTN|nr:wax ester/triacylglycerol synthase family O-acyltransferase [Nonomuraea soli]MBA2890048.1 WS/DGAT/MGAT family acyltransferase [Nonomuraea soli]
MRQLTALDAQFLNFETATNVANVGGLSILHGPVSRQEVLARMAERIDGVPQLRRRLVPVPMGLDHPYWADGGVDLDYHVRELALPAPGDAQQLAEQVARIHERRLDRTRPLWEMYVIRGLAGARGAIYTKVHHAAVDGLTGAEVLAALMDPAPPPLPCEPEPVPEAWQMLTRGAAHLVANPLHLLRFLAEAVPLLDQLPVASRLPGTRWLSRRAHLPELPEFVAPWTPLSGPVSAHRRFAFVSLPLEEIKQVKKAAGVTVNDVVMAVSAGALRRWLIAHDALPDRPLIAGVPFSLRARAEAGEGNQVTIMITELATQMADAAERLAAVSAAMRLIKERFALSPAGWLHELTGSLPAALNGLADRAAFALVGRTMPPINVIISNVPGPQMPLSIAGVRVLAHYPLSVVTNVSGGLNLSVFSYDGAVQFGITACRELVPDVWDFPGYLRESLDELREEV